MRLLFTYNNQAEEKPEMSWKLGLGRLVGIGHMVQGFGGLGGGFTPL